MPPLDSQPASAAADGRLSDLFARVELRLGALERVQVLALHRLASELEHPVTLSDLWQADFGELVAAPGFGPVTLDAIESLRARTRVDLKGVGALLEPAAAHEADALAGEPRLGLGRSVLPLGKLPDEAALVFTGELKGAPDQVGRYLLGELDRCLVHARPVEVTVFRHRLSLGEALETYRELGAQIGLAHERARQLEAECVEKLKHALPLAPAAVAGYLQRCPAETLLASCAEMRERFTTERGALKFLEVVAGLRPGTLVHEHDGALLHGRDAFDEYFALTPGPVRLAEVLPYFARRWAMDAATARRRVDAFVRAGVVALRGDEMFPRALSSRAAIAHVLAREEHRGGRPMTDILKIVQKEGLTAQPLPRRQDRSRNPWIYRVGPGRYAHRRFILEGEQHRERVLQKLAEALEAHGGEANLVELKPVIDPDHRLSYALVRHLARTFGREHGIHFVGVSSIDTVSLTPGHGRRSLREVLASALEEAEGPLPFETLQARLGGRSRQHTYELLRELRQEGRVLRVGRHQYWSARRMVRPAEVEALRELVEEERAADPRPMTLHWLAAQARRRLGPRWTEPVTRAAASIAGREAGWRLHGSLLGGPQAPDASLPAILHRHQAGDDSAEAQAQLLEALVRATPREIRIAIRGRKRGAGRQQHAQASPSTAL